MSGLLGQESQELSRLNLALAFSVPCIPSFLLTPPDANVRLGFFQHLHQYRGAESCSVLWTWRFFYVIQCSCWALALQYCRASRKQESTIANHYISRLSTAVSAVSHSVLPYQHEVQDAIDRAGLDATLLREFCTLGAMVLVPWQHCPLFDGSTGSCSMRTLRLWFFTWDFKTWTGHDWIGGVMNWFSSPSSFLSPQGRPCAFGTLWGDCGHPDVHHHDANQLGLGWSFHRTRNVSSNKSSPSHSVDARNE